MEVTRGWDARGLGEGGVIFYQVQSFCLGWWKNHQFWNQFWKLRVVMAAQHCEYTSCHGIMHLVKIANLKYILLQWKNYQKQKPNSALGALTDEIGSVRGKMWRYALGFSWTTSGCGTALAYVSAIMIGGIPSSILGASHVSAVRCDLLLPHAAFLAGLLSSLHLRSAFRVP